MSGTDRAAHPLSSVCLVIALVCVGSAIHWRDGEYHIRAIQLIGLALVAVFGAVGFARRTRHVDLSPNDNSSFPLNTAVGAVATGVVLLLGLLLVGPPSGWKPWSNDLKRIDPSNLLLYRTGLCFIAAAATALLVHRHLLWVQAVAVVAVGPLVAFAVAEAIDGPFGDEDSGLLVGTASANGLDWPRMAFTALYTSASAALLLVFARRVGWLVPFVVIVVLHLLLGVWMVRSSPSPHIDVFVFQQLGGKALLSGDNPYAVTYPDIYANTAQAQDRDVYGTGLSKDGQLAFGFPYPPLSLLMSTAGYAIGNDHRYAQVAAFSLAGLLIGLTARRSVADAAHLAVWAPIASLLLLLTPRAFFIIGRGWTEPLVVFLLALTIFVAVRFPKVLPIALGLFLASKQYLVFAVPLAWLLVPDPRDWRATLKLIGGALLVTAVVSLPLALWDFRAFWHSMVTVQKVAPFREDALSWLVWFYQRSGGNGSPPGSWIAFAIAVPVLLLSLRYCPRTPGGFALALAAVYLPFIAFNKQAFANYYLFVLGALACALAASPPAVGHGRRPAET